MKFSVTIPQLFYDVISKILPGFLFTIIFKYQLQGTGFEFPLLGTTGEPSFMFGLVKGIGLLFLCYFVGVVLRAFVWKPYEEGHDEHGSVEENLTKRTSASQETQGLKEMYQRIRLVNAGVGFRLLKLRAEARAIEVSGTGMILLVLCGLSILFARLFFPDSLSAMQWREVVLKLVLPIPFLFGFLKLRRRAWRRYEGNIRILYPLVCIEKLGRSDKSSERT